MDSEASAAIVSLTARADTNCLIWGIKNGIGKTVAIDGESDHEEPIIAWTVKSTLKQGHFGRLVIRRV